MLTHLEKNRQDTQGSGALHLQGLEGSTMISTCTHAPAQRVYECRWSRFLRRVCLLTPPSSPPRSPPPPWKIQQAFRTRPFKFDKCFLRSHRTSHDAIRKKLR
ncbi:hypothetical protein EVAR_13820_1 [Eumeta japonica]|uniref:Uncharacterized protein n=1 Tax=Eumeta variegata TaxID=151549 RepID=A0A4C1U181_EUMVA|nr:hypothetical protein EVAR_13820_1 [Eumeta japonica]